MTWGYLQRFDRSPASRHRRPVDIYLIYLRHLSPSQANGNGARADHHKQRLAALRREQLGVCQPLDNHARTQNYSCGNYRTNEGSNADFIQTCNGHQTLAPQLTLQSPIGSYSHAGMTTRSLNQHSALPTADPQ
jgi:hypothetical protein